VEQVPEPASSYRPYHPGDRQGHEHENLLGSVPEVKLVADETKERAGAHSLTSVGRRGLGTVQRARVGSVSTKVVRAAGGPVLVYPHARVGTEATGG